MGSGDGSVAKPRRIDPQLIVLVAVVVVIAVTPLVLWMVSVNQTSAGSVPPQSPVPVATLSPSALDLAKAFRPYSNVVPVVSFVGVDPAGAGGKVTPADFAEQMEILDQAGFSTVTVEQVRSMVLGQSVSLPVNPILLTFDVIDGSLWKDVDPILAAHGFGAVAFLTTADVTDPVRLESLNLDTLDAMKISRRWGFGVHADPSSLAHAPGQPIGDWELQVRNGLSAGRSAVDSALGLKVIAMSYPFSDLGLPDGDPAVERRLPELVGEQFDLGFLETRRSVVVTTDIDKTMAPRLPQSRTSLSPEGFLGAIEDVLPRPPIGSVAATAWGVTGDGSCVSSENTLIISADRSTWCRLESSVTETWDDVSISALVDGVTTSATATFRMRERALDRIEVALSADQIVVQRQTAGVWAPVVKVPIPNGSNRELRSIVIRLRGSRLRVVLDGAVVVDADVGPSSGAGTVSLAAIVDEAAVVRMTQLSVAAPIPA